MSISNMPAEGPDLPLFLAKFEKQRATLLVDGNAPVDVDLSGSLLVAGEPAADRTLVLNAIRRLSVWTEPVDVLGGMLSLAGPHNALDFAPAVSGVIDRFEARIFYGLLSEQKPECVEDDAIYPPLETLLGKLSWNPAPPVDDKTLRMRVGFSFDLLLDTVVGAVRGLALDDQELDFRLLEDVQPGIREANSLVSCGIAAPASAPGNTHPRFFLNLRFVSNTVSGLSAAQIKAIAQLQVDGACRVWWAKGGVRIDPQPLVDSIVPALHNGQFGPGLPGQYADLQSARNASNDVEVFLVDQLRFQQPGGAVTEIGGLTLNCRAPLAYIILTLDEARNNEYVLAHEIGHVLGLQHPDGVGCPGLPVGADCSVMLADSPDSPRNPSSNLAVIQAADVPLGPVYDPLYQQGGWRPDDTPAGVHWIRDHPYDDGSVSTTVSQSFPALYTHSDVWNAPQLIDAFDARLYADGVTRVSRPDFSPAHSNPQRVGTNHMHVRVHCCRKLAGPVSVQLFLAQPGSSSAPLHHLTSGGALTFAGPSIPSPGRYPIGAKVQTLQNWSAPASYPPHCCVFAVATSTDKGATAASGQLAAILANLPASRFSMLAPLLGSSNDVAQRNLQLEPVMRGMSGVVVLPFVVVGNPLEGPADTRLAIRASVSPAIQSLALEVEGQTVYEWKPRDDGEPEMVLIARDNQPGDDRFVRVVVRLNDAPPDNEPISIDLVFFAGEQEVAGYRHVLTAASADEVLDYSLDALTGAIDDVDAVFLPPEARGQGVVRAIRRRLVRHRKRQTASLASLRLWVAPLAELAERIDGANGRETEAIQRRLFELAGVLASRRLIQAPLQIIRRVRTLADLIQEQAGRAALRSYQ